MTKGTIPVGYIPSGLFELLAGGEKHINVNKLLNKCNKITF
jgi:hypothetical protein